MAENEYFILFLNQNSDNGPPRGTGMALASPRLCQERSDGNNPVAAASCRLSFTMHVFARNEISLPRAKRGGSNPVLNNGTIQFFRLFNNLDCFATLAMTLFDRHEVTKQSSILWLCNTGNTNEL